MSAIESRERAVRENMDSSVREWRQLMDKMIAAKSGKENTEREMAEITAEIREEYGVSSIEEFRTRYADSLAENEKKVADFKQLLEECRKAQEEVEAEFE